MQADRDQIAAMVARFQHSIAPRQMQQSSSVLHGRQVGDFGPLNIEKGSNQGEGPPTGFGTGERPSVTRNVDTTVHHASQPATLTLRDLTIPHLPNTPPPVIVAKTVPTVPGALYSYDNDPFDLINELNYAPDLALGTAAHVRAELHSDADTPYSYPVEAQIYARDPEEVAQFFEDGFRYGAPYHYGKLYDFLDPATIRAEVQSAAGIGVVPNPMPFALAMLAPAYTPQQAKIIGLGPIDASTATQGLTTNTFWGPFTTPAGVAATPAGGSVKALRINKLGECTNEQFLFNFTQNLQNAISGGSLPCPPGILDKLVIFDVTGVPLMRHDGRAQFFFAIDLYTKKTIIAPLDCRMAGGALYDLIVDENGAIVFDLATIPEPAQLNVATFPVKVSSWGGSGCKTFTIFIPPFLFQFGSESLLEQALTHDVRYNINTSIRNQQVLPPEGAAFRNPFALVFPTFRRTFVDVENNSTMGCNPTAPDPGAGFDEYVFHLATGTNICAGARNDFCNMIRWGFSNSDPLTFPASGTGPGCTPGPFDPVELVKLLNSVNAVDENGRLRHWRCEPFTDPNDPKTNVNVSSSPKFPNFEDHNPCSPRNRNDGSVDYGLCVTGECIFVPPAKRLVMNPDSVQIIFADKLTEWDNASVAALYAIDTLKALVGQGSRSLMCNYSRPTDFLFTRQQFVMIDGVSCPRGGWR